jgi:hypothetical protein
LFIGVPDLVTYINPLVKYYNKSRKSLIVSAGIYAARPAASQLDLPLR